MRPAPDLTHLAACALDLQAALADQTRGPRLATGHAALQRALRSASRRLPRAYRRGVLAPLLAELDRLGPAGLRALPLRDPNRAACLRDLAAGLVQARRGPATRALQEVVGDLYDGFLGAEARDGLRRPAGRTLPPLVKWGRPDLGPYTWPVTFTGRLGARAGVVGFPPAAAQRGLLLWAALAHETAGHDVLAAQPGLRSQLAAAARRALPAGLGAHWAERIDETASDVLGILNMGPAAALAIVLHLRALQAVAGRPARLRERPPLDPHHPAEAARGYLAAAVVRALRFPGREGWASALEAEVDRDVRAVWLGSRRLSRAGARRMAARLARALLRTRLPALGRHTLAGVQTWKAADEEVVARLRGWLDRPGPVSRRLGEGAYAAHAVAAGVTAALAGGPPRRLQHRMIALLAAMNRREPRWAR